MTYDKDTLPEDKEKWNLDRERDADALKDYVRVERVIAKKKDEDGETEYLVKCMLSTIVVLDSPLLMYFRERSLLQLLHLGKGRSGQ